MARKLWQQQLGRTQRFIEWVEGCVHFEVAALEFLPAVSRVIVGGAEKRLRIAKREVGHCEEGEATFDRDYDAAGRAMKCPCLDGSGILDGLVELEQPAAVRAVEQIEERTLHLLNCR